ncbi:MAG: site-2 protease family protein [Solirubrobacterales bacterium]|nr:site-2 protease family protein [Solirubrobacterales bacterium]MCB0861208.1 site-2 protease family protein [Solirubrobacterales bacterium]HRV59715.1 site-2 protease family protein [Solirubrobacterales bacterium]
MFGGGNSITLFRVAGIRIAVDWSWFVFLFIVIVWLSSFYGDILDEPGSTQSYLLAVASAAGFFGSILLHEMGHAFAAKRSGIGIRTIRLWLFGGIAEMDQESPNPGTEFKVAVAGPLVSLLIAIVLCVIGIQAAGVNDFRDALEMRITASTTGPITMVAWLAAVNILVLGFNLLPAFPMDGGRIVRSIAWKVTGKRSAATRFAAGLGRIFGFLFIALGIVWAVNGNVFSGLWLAMIGFLVNSSARAASQSTVTEKLEHVTVAEVMDPEPVAIPGDIDCARAMEEYFLRFGWSWFPVVDASGTFIGMAVRDRVEAVPEVERMTTRVDTLTERDPAFAVSRTAGLDSLLGNPQLRRFGALMVTDDQGLLAGVVTIEQLGRALQA